MARTVFFKWSGAEYEYQERSADWYWVLGIVATAVVVVAILFGNILLALVVIAAAAAIALQTVKRPTPHQFSLTEEGLVIGRRLYPYDSMFSFSVLEYVDEAMPPSLSIYLKSFWIPHLVLPLHDVDPVAIYDFLGSRVREGRHEESLVDRLVEFFRL